MKLTKQITKAQERAIKIRNESWEKNNLTPDWVKVEEVGLDQFFTHTSMAKECFDQFIAYLVSQGEDVSKYKFIEPSAGAGAFYDLLPPAHRIGIDVESFRPDYIRRDFLSWEPDNTKQHYVCVGNPPFGYRAWLALAFLNHAAQFSDYVAFILPMAFQSDGKGNPKDRVKGLRLVHSSILNPEGFIDDSGKVIKINALWQIWKRDDQIVKIVPKTCNRYIDLFTVDINKNRLCGQARRGEADFFLQRTFFGDPPKPCTDFSDVNYGCGYGIVIKKNKRKITRALKSIDWIKYSNLAAHNCRHISMYHIKRAITDAGFTDE